MICSYVKNRLLTTLDSGQNPEKAGSVMEKAKCVVASVIDVFQALGTSLVAFGGPLT